ncbi:MAG: hypothetical protein HPY60_11220 [Candidatus Methanofastidiosum sp.]|nr:hypothetical protein [Methanofastidiosum sp.]
MKRFNLLHFTSPQPLACIRKKSPEFNNLIEIFKKGLYLETSNQLIIWNVPFDNLKNLGNPEFRQTSDQRADLIWKNEKILNGLTVDLTVMRWFGLTGINKKFKYAYAYLCQEDFEKTKVRLNAELGKEGKYKKINDLEYKYTWDLGKCKIELIQGDRFGPNWTLNIKHKSSWYGLLR